MKRRNSTQRDIARETNSSQTLVSLVLSNSKAEVAESTRLRILQAAKELGYVPRRKNPRTSTHKNKVFGYIRPYVERGGHHEHWIHDAYDEYYDRIQNLLVEAAYKKGASVVVRPYTHATELTHWLVEWGVDGVFWHASDRELLEWIAERYPVVQVNRNMIVEADAVTSHLEESVTLGLDYLTKRGHRRIAFIPTVPSRSNFWKMRTRAYMEYECAGLEKYPSLVEVPVTGVPDYIDHLMTLLALPENERPTAVLGNDHMILLVLRACQERGIKVPEELSLFGIDNTSASMFTNPALTTIDHQQREVVEQAVELMFERFLHPNAAYRKVYITPTVVERSSARELSARGGKVTVKDKIEKTISKN